MTVLIAEHMSILSFRQEDHMSDVASYDRFTTRVKVARQAGVCYYTPALLEAKATQLKVGDYDTLADDQQKKIREQFEQEYLASLFLNNSSAKLHTQLKKDVPTTTPCLPHRYPQGLEVDERVQAPEVGCSHCASTGPKIIEARKKKSKAAYDDDRSVASVKLDRNYDVICIDVAGKEKRMSSEHYGFSFWRHSPPRSLWYCSCM
jgi:hypothetical protein